MVYRFKGFQEPEIVRTGQNLQVFMNDFETTAFIIMKKQLIFYLKFIRFICLCQKSKVGKNVA